MTSIEEALRSGAVLAKVKPLEWQDDHYGEEAQADTPWGMWCVTKSYNDPENKRSAHFTPSFRVKRSIHPDVKAAKAAAQADYEARILSALSPDPTLLALIEERDRLKVERDEALRLYLEGVMTKRALAAEAKCDALREAAVGAAAALSAAISLLERTPKAAKATPSARMFGQMLSDYRATLEATRCALTKEPDNG